MVNCILQHVASALLCETMYDRLVNIAKREDCGGYEVHKKVWEHVAKN